jgi:tetratricopeptide (TPR) repeat protein
LTLGYIYYELSYYREAISHFRQVAADREEYPQALLAASWAAVKSKDYQAAITTLNLLIRDFEETEYGEEAHFLLGQAYVELGLFDFAMQQYDYIVQHYPESNGAAERLAEVHTGLEEQEAAVEKMKINLLLLESKLIDMIPLQTDGKVPKYIEEERARLNAKRDLLFENIVAERDNLERFNERIFAIRRQMERMESRRHWRAYAEYGKTRAFFLKGLSGLKQ